MKTTPFLLFDIRLDTVFLFLGKGLFDCLPQLLKESGRGLTVKPNKHTTLIASAYLDGNVSHLMFAIVFCIVQFSGVF